jgi:geranylgeranyl diphosphate synthase type I
VLLNPADPLADEFQNGVGETIAALLRRKRLELAPLGTEFELLLDIAEKLLAGGKRLRPAFCTWGYLAFHGGLDAPDWLVTTSASLDVLHASALVHDDVMDLSDTRRGWPTAHRQLRDLHARRGWDGDSEAFGRNGAILLGNLLWSWSAELANQVDLADGLGRAARAILDRLRTQVNAGQYLDIVTEAERSQLLRRGPDAIRERVEQVVEYKTARYTIVQPLQLGATLAGAPADAMGALADFGSALGRAFQFRDDVLGVFGDESVTGKPIGDDLSQGKLTAIVADTIALADSGGAARLESLLGRPDLSPSQIEDLRDVIRGSGALASIEARISDAHARALTALETLELTADGALGLRTLAERSVRREF